MSWRFLWAAFTPDVVWQFIVTFLGVLAAALLAWRVEQWKEKKERARRRKGLRQVLVQGLTRNLATLRIARADIEKDRKTPSARFETGHFDATVISAVETLFEDDLEGYGQLLNAGAGLAHMNRRFDQVVDVERLHLEIAAQMRLALPLEPYVGNMLSLLVKLDSMVVAVLNRLHAQDELGEVEAHLTSSDPPKGG